MSTLSKKPYALDSEMIQRVIDLLALQHQDTILNRRCKAAKANLLGIHPAQRAVDWHIEPGGVLIIESATDEGIWYRCTGDSCSCAARVSRHNPLGWCWHQAAWLIIFTERMIADPYFYFDRVSGSRHVRQHTNHSFA